LPESSELAGARVLVTGAAGFIGASLTPALLAAGAEVHALVRPGRTMPDAAPHEADLRDADALRHRRRRHRHHCRVHRKRRSDHGGREHRISWKC
jgi:nucleoside-diphosphate-sugar epimerase